MQLLHLHKHHQIVNLGPITNSTALSVFDACLVGLILQGLCKVDIWLAEWCPANWFCRHADWMRSDLIPIFIPVGLVNQPCPQQRAVFTSDWRIKKKSCRAKLGPAGVCGLHARTPRDDDLLQKGSHSGALFGFSPAIFVISDLWSYFFFNSQSGSWWKGRGNPSALRRGLELQWLFCSSCLYDLFYVHWVYNWSVKPAVVSFISFIHASQKMKFDEG